jgi:hypothetical protein
MVNKRTKQPEQQINSNAEEANNAASPIKPDTSNNTSDTFKNSAAKTGTYDEEFLEYTIKVWKKYSLTPLTMDDAQEICDNFIGFYKPLLETRIERLQKIEDMKQTKFLNNASGHTKKSV